MRSLILLPVFVSLSSAYHANLTAAGKALPEGTIFDCRMPKSTKPTTFDSPDTNPFLNDTAFGTGLKWSDIIKVVSPTNSLFDPKGEEVAMDVSLSDKSIFGFNPAYPVETTIRRADLSPNVSTPYSTPAGYPDVSGIKTLHFSLQNNPKNALNYSHAYRLVWMENQAFNHEQWQLRTGTLEKMAAKTPVTLTLVGEDYVTPLWSTPFTNGWHNFGLVLNFENNTIQVFYSTNKTALSAATPVIPLNLTGAGQYHFGPYKFPTGANMNDGAHGQHSGYQEPNIHESIMYAGIFMESSAAGKISVSSGTKIDLKSSLGGKASSGTGTGTSAGVRMNATMGWMLGALLMGVAFWV